MVISMYKRIIVILSFLLMLTGCGVKEKELDFKKLTVALNQLTLEKMDYQNLPQVLEEDLDTLTIYTSQEILDKLGIDEDMYQNIFFCESKEEVEAYLVIEPKTNEKELVEQKIKEYWETKIEEMENEEEKQAYQTRLEQSYGNHLIYIVGNNVTKKLDKIKDTKQKIFPSMISLERDDMEKVLGLNPSKLEAYTCAVTDKLDTVTQYMIVKYKKNEETSIRQNMHDYFENLENEWKEKDTKQFELLKNRMEKQLGDYLIYLVSEDNDMAYKTIQEFYK